MDESVVCVQCDLPEEQCTCERYCWLCQGQHGIRLCTDGQYYCPDCREVCEIQPVSERDE